MHLPTNRRDFIKTAAVAAATTTTLPAMAGEKKKKKPLFRLSLAQWSLHRAIFGGKIKNENFTNPVVTSYNLMYFSVFRNFSFRICVYIVMYFSKFSDFHFC